MPNAVPWAACCCSQVSSKRFTDEDRAAIAASLYPYPGTAVSTTGAEFASRNPVIVEAVARLDTEVWTEWTLGMGSALDLWRGLTPACRGACVCPRGQERQLVARLEKSPQRELLETFLKRRQELVVEEERLGRVRGTAWDRVFLRRWSCPGASLTGCFTVPCATESPCHRPWRNMKTCCAACASGWRTPTRASCPTTP